jgi:hypothetical protein
MRLAVSGSHRTGKSTLIAAFLRERSDYQAEPEAFELLGDDIELTPEGGPTPEGLRALLDHTLSVLESRAPRARVVFERSPVDYLAYAAASRNGWHRAEFDAFVSACVPIVRASLRHLDLIAYLPVSPLGPSRRRPGEAARFRRRVDHCLRRALIDDEYDLFGERGAPAVVELSPIPERQLAELVRLAQGE